MEQINASVHKCSHYIALYSIILYLCNHIYWLIIVNVSLLSGHMNSFWVYEPYIYYSDRHFHPFIIV